MRVYSSFTFDMNTGAIEDAKIYEYEGPVAECKGGKGGDGGAAQAREDEQKRQEKIREGTTNVNSTFDSQFNDDYYNKQRDSYLNYATPQLNDQYSDAQKQLTFSLDRSGMLDSSARAQKEADLEKLYDTNRQSVADKALAYSTGAKTNVEDARSNLISMLNATGDATGAANSAIARASALSAPQAYDPLGQLFTTFTSGLGTQAAQEKAAALSSGTYKSPYNTGLFSSSGAVQNS